MNDLLLRAEAVVARDGTLHDAAVRVRDGRIAEVGASLPPEDGEQTLTGALLLPGFVDLHWHGAGGFGLARAEDVRGALQHAAAAGVTTAYAGLGHGRSFEEIEASVRAAASVVGTEAEGARLAGLFLEGPYISLAKRGAWSPPNLRAPDQDELQALIGAGGGRLKRINVAPELPGALDFIRAAVGAGLVVSIGHSDATYEQALAGIEAGATIANHTFNAMSALGHRTPGLAGAALSDERLLAELILDGVHVHPAAARALYRARGPRGVALITDGSQFTGLPDGVYRRGGRTVTIADGSARLPDGTLAGSISSFDRDLRHARAWLTDDLTALAWISSGNAARALGIDRETGAISPGLRADLVLLDAEWQVLATVVGGRVVYVRGDRVPLASAAAAGEGF
jgi:N-acetylglucosamine-6-phosphate deacetylase